MIKVRTVPGVHRSLDIQMLGLPSSLHLRRLSCPPDLAWTNQVRQVLHIQLELVDRI